MILHNRVSRELLLRQLEEEDFRRITLSFYRYVIINNPQEFRDNLFLRWNQLGCFGRIYIAREGINAQMSVPENNLTAFLNSLEDINELRQMPIKYAVEDDGKSFFKLTIKVRPKIVADGLNDDAFDVTNVGRHLSALEFHTLSEQDNTLVIDMRNHYESEVGRFKNAWCPDADTFSDAIHLVEKEFQGQKDRKILLYCTGGIRCEKASAYLKHAGFSDVNQLYGGIIAYAHEVKKLGIPSNFTGKNFVFDQRLGESIDGKVISHCHQCGTPCDTHVNCANDDCHLLFIQCKACSEANAGCCSTDCKQLNELPLEQRQQKRLQLHEHNKLSKIFNKSLRPRLVNISGNL